MNQEIIQFKNEERFYSRKNVSHKLVTERFLKLPRRCQEMFFEYLESGIVYDESQYVTFDIVGFDYDECKSPIEVIYNFAFNILNFTYYKNTFNLEPQAPIEANGKDYKVDFLFDSKENFQDFRVPEKELKLVIECDGHDFHKATKQQVKHDNERDMNLKLAGYDVLHFSGSQIYTDPWLCAEETIKYILLKLGKIWEAGKVDEWMDKNSQEAT